MKFNFTTAPTLKTKRLVFREVEVSDDKEVLFLRSDKAMNRYITRSRPKDVKEAQAFIKTTISGIRSGIIIYWAITLFGDNKMIGSICLWNFSSDEKTAELGYDLNPIFHNQGIMSESIKRVLKFGFSDLKLSKIDAYTHYENAASTRLLINNGFQILEGKKDKDNSNNIIFRIEEHCEIQPEKPNVL